MQNKFAFKLLRIDRPNWNRPWISQRFGKIFLKFEHLFDWLWTQITQIYIQRILWRERLSGYSASIRFSFRTATESFSSDTSSARNTPVLSILVNGNTLQPHIHLYTHTHLQSTYIDIGRYSARRHWFTKWTF